MKMMGLGEFTESYRKKYSFGENQFPDLEKVLEEYHAFKNWVNSHNEV